jgi:hypothetical protein
MTRRVARPRRLVQAAGYGGRVIGRRLGGGCGRRGLRTWRACRGSRFRRRGVCLLMRNVFVVAGGARPRWDALGQAAGPMRPVIGRKARHRAACPDRAAEAERDEDRGEPFNCHATRWVAPWYAGTCAAFVAGL